MRNHPSVFNSVSEKLVKYTEHQQPQAFLLDDLLMCIFIRLDVRGVARCRCVCKKWKHLMTSNPQFEDSLLMPVSNIPMILAKHTIFSQPLPQTAEFCIDKWWQTETTIHKVGRSRYNGRYTGQQSSQNGFIFSRISHLLPYENIVLNPITGEQVTIFLHDGSLPKYVVDREADILGIFLHPIQRDQFCTLWRVEVFVHSDYHTQYKMLNLGSGQPTCWRNIGHLWSHWWVPGTSVICLDGFMYWMVNHHDHDHNHDPCVPLIIAFDMKTEDFTEIPLPSTCIHFPFKSNLVNADGFLSLVQVVVDEVITVTMWTLKDPKRRFLIASQYVLWQVQPPPKLWQVQQHLCVIWSKGPRAVAIVNSELIIEGEAGYDGSKGLFVCNLEFGTMRELGENKYSHDVRFWAHHPSIASLRNCQPVLHITQE